MVAYKDILNSFWWDESYADRFQAAALKWDNDAMQSIAAEYKNRDTTATAQQPQQPQQPQWQQSQQSQQQTYNWNNLGNWQYGNNTADRQEQIVSNLNKAYEQDPSKFGDWSTFSKEFNYDYSGRSDKEKETMRNWYSSIQDKQAQQQAQQWTQWTWQQWMQTPTQYDPNDVGNTDYYFNQLMWWAPLQWTWLAITNATTRYDNWKYLSGLQPSVIASAVEQWILSWVWQEMQDLKQYSPELYAQVQSALQWQQTLNDINEVWNWIYNWLTKTETNWNYTNYDMTSDYVQWASVIQQYNTNLYNKILWLWWDTAAYVWIVASMLQNPEIQWTKNKVEELEWEVNRIKENIYNIWDDARVALWSEAPESLVSAYISQQTKQLQNQLRTVQNSLQVEQWKLNNQLSEVDTMIDALNYWMKLQASNDSSSSGSTNNYQYISASKYQEAWYFDKTTWQFYRLWELPDTSDYQSSDPTRLQEIKDNLTNIANSDDAYVFRDRNAFNTYFKYSQRWAAQKKVLDDFWNANSARLKPIADQKYKEYQAAQARNAKTSSGWWWTWWGWGWTGEYSWIKKALMNWTFSWAWTTTNLKKYWYKWWADSNTILYQIWKWSTPSEIKSILSNLPDNQSKQDLIHWYITTNADTIRNAKWSWLFSSDKKARNKAVSNMLSEIWAAWRAKSMDADKLSSLIASWIS